MEKKSNALIITDRTDLFDSMHDIFNNGRHRVAIARNGAKAIDLTQKIHFDMILVVDAPKLNGRDAYWEIKQYAPEAIVMKISLYDRKAKLGEAINHEIDYQRIGELIN